MSTSVIHPSTIQIRPSRLTGLVVGVAILTGVTTWSVTQVATESDASNSKSGVASAPSAAAQAYVDGVVALDVEQRAAVFGNVFRAQPSVQSVNAHSPELQAVNVPDLQARNVDLEAIAAMARAEGLTGLSPASLSAPTRQSVQSVNAHSPELQAVNVPDLQARNVDLEAIAAMARAEGLTGLSPASLSAPTRQSVQSVNAHSPELQSVNVSGHADAIAALPRDQLVASFGTFN